MTEETPIDDAVVFDFPLKGRIVLVEHPTFTNCHILATIDEEKDKVVMLRYYDHDKRGFAARVSKKHKRFIVSIVETHTPQETAMLSDSLLQAYRRCRNDIEKARAVYREAIDGLASQYKARL